jgi:hypothetical protein
LRAELRRLRRAAVWLRVLRANWREILQGAVRLSRAMS